ncbi:MAG: amino acid permease [Planctomycetota bacterium]
MTTKSGIDSHRMGLGSAIAVVAASMIGAGVYTTSGFTLQDLQSPSLVVFAWLIGGVIATCGAICYGSLARRITESGGEYVFLARAVHPAAGMTAGWVSLLAGFTGAMAFAATTFGVYAAAWLPIEADDTEFASQVLATLIVIVAALTHGSGLRRGTNVQNTIVLLKLILIGLFLIIAYSCVTRWAAIPSLEWQTGTEARTSTEAESSGWSGLLLFANALTWISLSFSGFNAAVYMTDEIDSPRRNVPRAMLFGTLAVSLLYVMLNTVFVFAPDPSSVIGRADVAMAATGTLADVLRDAGWGSAPWLVTLVRIAITLGLATSVLALMQTGPRVYRKMASDGFLPGFLSDRRDQQATLAAIWMQTVLALLVIWTASLRAQLDYLGFTLSVCAALCCSLTLLPRRWSSSGQNATSPANPEVAGKSPAIGSDDSEQVWGYPVVPLIYVAGTLTVATLTAIRVPMQAAVGLGTLSIGLISYLVMSGLWGSRNSGDRRN